MKQIISISYYYISKYIPVFQHSVNIVSSPFAFLKPMTKFCPNTVELKWNCIIVAFAKDLFSDGK